MKTAWVLGAVVMAIGTARAEPLIESHKILGSFHEIEVELDQAAATDPSQYTILDREDRRPLVATSVEQISVSVAFVVPSGEPLLPGLLGKLGLERFPGVLSTGMVIEYGASVRVLAEGRLDQLATATLRPGPVEPGHLPDAIDRALADLSRTPSDRRLLIVLGNGEIGDTAPAAEHQLMLLKRLARAESTATIAIVRPPATDRGLLISRMIPMTSVQTDDAKLRDFVRGTIDRLAMRKRVVFVDHDADVLRWDGEERALLVNLAGEDSMEDQVLLPKTESTCSSPRFGWWWAALAAVLAILIAWSWSRRPTRADPYSSGLNANG